MLCFYYEIHWFTWPAIQQGLSARLLLHLTVWVIHLNMYEDYPKELVHLYEQDNFYNVMPLKAGWQVAITK